MRKMYCFAKRNCSLLLLFIVFCYNATAHDYREVFGDSYAKAERSAAAIRPLLQKYAKAFNEDARLMEAIIFPELMRYNSLYDAVETGSLIGLYTRFGADYADFSIGMLQMKPSYAEGIERQLQQHKHLPWVKALGFDDLAIADSYKDRMARVDRLESNEWQVKYLVAMLKCLRIKNSNVKLKGDELLLFAAAAYNCGWQKPAAIIRTYINKKHYSLSHWNASKKYAFADIALYRYKEII